MYGLLSLVYTICIMTWLLTSVLVIAVKTVPRLKVKAYIRAKLIFALSSIIMAVSNVFVWHHLFHEKANIEMFTLSTVAMGHLQSCVMIFIILALFRSRYVNSRNVFKFLLPLLVFLLVYYPLTYFIPDVKVYDLASLARNLTNPGLLLRVALLLAYVVEMALYVVIFRREQRMFKDKVSNHFSDITASRMRRTTILFWVAVFIGSLVIPLGVFPYLLLDAIVTVLITVFYFGFAILYINYQYEMLQLNIEGSEAEKKLRYIRPALQDLSLPLEKRMENLMEGYRFYTQQGITIADLADMLDVSKRTLSTYINTKYDQNFNAWVNGLRVEYARELLCALEWSDMSVDDIAERCGFTNASMFCREFSRLVGESPQRYRKTHRRPEHGKMPV